MLYLIVALLCVQISLSAQQNNSATEIEQILPDSFVRSSDLLKKMYKTVAADTAKISVKSFDKNFRSRYNDNDFDYGNQNSGLTFWQKFKKWINKILKKIFGLAPDAPEPKYNLIILKTLSALLIISALFVIIRVLIRRKGRWFLNKKNAALPLDINDAENLIKQADFEALIAEYEKNNNNRFCIRLYFLWLLKTLQDKKRIVWLPDKTNSEYLNEIQNEQLKTEFAYLCYLYDYVWYGEFYVNDTDYVKAKTAFLRLIGEEVSNE